MTSTTITPTDQLREPLADLRRRVAGALHLPDDETWDAARAAWIVTVDQRPLAVLEARDVQDVVTAVRWARDHEVQVSAQPTGHGTTGPFEQVMLLRTGGLRGIEVDPAARTVTFGAGVRAGELLAALDGTGLTFLAGSNPDPTVVGMTVTGGLSWFGRAFGAGADSVEAVELVDGMGRLRTLTATGDDSDLFWAVRGGGGDFGIITRMTVRLHPVPQLYGGRLFWPIEQTRAVLDAFRDVTEGAPDGLTVWFHCYRFPPFPEIPEPLRGQAIASVAVAHLGTSQEAGRLLAPFRAVPGIVLDLLGEVPIGALDGIAGEPTEPSPGRDWAVLLHALDDRTVERLVDAVGAGAAHPLTMVQVRHLGGALARQHPTGGSFGAVSEQYLVGAIGIPIGPGGDAGVEAGFADIEAAVSSVSSGRAPLAFLGRRSTDHWWSPATRARLVAAKRAADPLGVIRSNRPVEAG
ncbi:FAD-binding oxidoreductase [Nocardioides sp.]|uniref:FAD-binding oxidoreductase n=1 Tax=Nocardioides sp. TaxID=35761 RepID=UPI002ED0782C